MPDNTTLTFDDLRAACSPGGASVLTSVCHLAPAVGAHGTVAPAKYLSGKGNAAKAVYAYTPTVVDGRPATAVVLSSKQDQAHRRQMALATAMTDDGHLAHALMRRVPRIALRYEATDVVYTDFDLPHRFADGHIRAGMHGSVPVTATDVYRAARDVTPRNVMPLFNLSPISVAHGVWDASRRSNQVRLPSAMVSEIVGVLADQGAAATEPLLRGAARVDPVAASIQLDKADIKKIADRQKDELSEKTYKKVSKASELGLGNIAPSLESIGTVACSDIIRSTVLSFAMLRQLRFGGSSEQGRVPRRPGSPDAPRHGAVGRGVVPPCQLPPRGERGARGQARRPLRSVDTARTHHGGASHRSPGACLCPRGGDGRVRVGRAGLRGRRRPGDPGEVHRR